MLKDRIKIAIDLLTTNKGEDWFTVLEEPKADKFIQFTYDEGYGIQLDLPVVALTEEELVKAEKLMAEYGITKREIEPEEDNCCCGEDHDHDEHCHCGCESEESEEVFESFNEKMKSAEQAIEIAYRVFKEVYQLTDDTHINCTVFR